MKYIIIREEENREINTDNRQVIAAVYHEIERNNLIPRELKVPYYLESCGIIINEL
jgi:hypothetical protein